MTDRPAPTYEALARLVDDAIGQGYIVPQQDPREDELRACWGRFLSEFRLAGTVWFSVPGDPMGKQRAAPVRGGTGWAAGGKVRMVTPKKTRCYEQKVGIMFARSAPGWPLTDDPHSVEIAAYVPMPASWGKRKKAEALNSPHTQKPDVDNVTKAIFDGLNGRAWIDDGCVFRATVCAWWTDKPGRVDVRVKRFERVEKPSLSACNVKTPNVSSHETQE